MPVPIANKETTSTPTLSVTSDSMGAATGTGKPVVPSALKTPLQSTISRAGASIPTYAQGKKPFIEIQNISKIVQARPTRAEPAPKITKILDDVSLNIYPGEYIIIFGDSGSGKSMLLNHILGLERPSSGRIVVNGRDIATMNESDLAYFRLGTLGMVYQDTNSLDDLMVWQNVALPAAIAGVTKDKRKQLALRLLESFRLESLADKYPQELSHGQNKKTAIVRALMNNPMMLIADEPTAGLDTKASDEIMENIRFINEQSNMTVVLVSNNPNYVYFPHRVVYLTDGKISRIVENRPLRSVAA